MNDKEYQIWAKLEKERKEKAIRLAKMKFTRNLNPVENRGINHRAQ